MSALGDLRKRQKSMALTMTALFLPTPPSWLWDMSNWAGGTLVLLGRAAIVLSLFGAFGPLL
jgi:hypothetical protein